MATKHNPYCCVDRVTGHIWHHCPHAAVEDAVAEARKSLDKLTDTEKQDLLETIRDIIENPK